MIGLSVTLPLGFAVLLLGCTDADQAQTGHGVDPCFSSADAGLLDEYEFTPEEVLDIARGTWSGRYPGGDYAGAFDIIVSVRDLEPADYTYRDDGVQYSQPLPSEHGSVLADLAEQRCVAMSVPALVQVEASEPLFTPDRDFRHVHVGGASLLSEPFGGGSVGYRYPPGAVLVETEVHEAGTEVDYLIVFGSDARLWVAIAPDGEERTEYLQSGVRR